MISLINGLLTGLCSADFPALLIKVSFEKPKSSGEKRPFLSFVPGEILERTACTIQPGSGELKLCMEVGFPANGRTINAKELIKNFLRPSAGRDSSVPVFSRLPQQKLQSVIELAEDQQYIRETSCPRWD